jgi:hypothetical protein
VVEIPYNVARRHAHRQPSDDKRSRRREERRSRRAHEAANAVATRHADELAELLWRCARVHASIVARGHMVLTLLLGQSKAQYLDRLTHAARIHGAMIEMELPGDPVRLLPAEEVDNDDGPSDEGSEYVP